MALMHPNFSPYIFDIAGIKPTWYGLMYVVGFSLAYFLARYYTKVRDLPWDKDSLGDLLFYSMLGAILGGRLGYVLFYMVVPYGFGILRDDPWLVFRVMDGGMSFHGGLLGVICALFLYGVRFRRNFLDVADFIAPLVPIGLFFGRIGNFINGELWGRPTDLPWGMIFFHAPDLQPRHPSQIYQALWEGVLMFVVLNVFYKKPRGRGQMAGLFLMLYAFGRVLLEFVREKDAQMSFYFEVFTMGQLLSVPMFVLGALLFAYGARKEK